MAGPLGCAGAILALANAEPERCIAAFEGDVTAQLSLATAHQQVVAEFPVGIKQLTARRFGTASAARMG
jgi:4-hydroxy-tetrahydrodipicolinate synthase